MTFYEQELRKIVGERYPDATYVGRACYERLRGRAIRDMKRTNGRISFKDAMDFQKSV